MPFPPPPQEMTLYGSRLWRAPVPRGLEVKVEGMSRTALVHKDGMLLFGSDGKPVSKPHLPHTPPSFSEVENLWNLTQTVSLFLHLIAVQADYF